MVAQTASKRLTLPVEGIAATAVGLAVALAVALLPEWRLESAVEASGLPAILPAAAPPLGWTARLALMLGFGGVAAAGLWLSLRLLLGGRRTTLALPARTPRAPAPRVRRADAHPDAPPRPPVNAHRDLGAPFLSDPPAAEMADAVPPEAPAERPLPRDLDQPMAAYDFAALPDMPRAPTPVVRPLVQAPPMVPDIQMLPDTQPEASAEGEGADRTDPAIGALVDRLDRGLARRRAQRPVPSEPVVSPEPVAAASVSGDAAHGSGGLRATLGTLRRMATGG